MKKILLFPFKILLLPFSLLAFFLGKLHWSAPPWINALKRLSRAHPKAAIGVLFASIASIVLLVYLDSLPKPIQVKAQINPVGITENAPDARPDDLFVSFVYDLAALNSDQPRPEGEPSVARIDLIGKVVDSGIKLSPAKKGTWRWYSDQYLQFTPETDWPAGTEYTLDLEPGIFSDTTKLSRHKYPFTTPEFRAQLDQVDFYQDPQDISVRRVIATLRFSHPVDSESLKSNLSMTMRPSNEEISAQSKNYSYQLSFDKNYREAYVQSEPVSLPSEPNYMKLAVKPGVKSKLGGQLTSQKIETRVVIPDIYSFLKVQSTQANIIRNEANDPEQVVMLEFTDDIEEAELLSKLRLYLLPKKGEQNGRNRWRVAQVKPEFLKPSNRVELKLIPNEKNHARLYNFVVDVPQNRFLYLKIDRGLSSVNKFVQASFFDTVLRSPEYPIEVNIVGEGSVLTHSGNHQLSIVSRGVPALRYRIGRLLPGQLNHLLSQSSGDISSPSFNSWGFDEHNISEFGEFVSRLKSIHPRLSQYASIDLSRFLPVGKDRFGLFFVEVNAWDPVKERLMGSVGDKRLILVTDLGVIVKNNFDGTQDIFVQSIANGEPVANASVELLGKNGIALFQSNTGYDGHVNFPSMQGFGAEQEPTVYVVKIDGDLSFIPYDRASRQINLSRFDIGGVQSARNQRNALNAYLFSDRGIYRPGETINLGLIVKNQDMANVEDIPLQLSIRGPRGNELKVARFKLPEKGLFDFQYPTEPTSATGSYSASLHLMRKNQSLGRMIGQADFKVEEFQPDTMRIENQLLDVSKKGWNTQAEMLARVSLKNLFGSPAQDRKISARVSIQPHSFRFAEYADYRFTDPHFNKDKKPLSLNRQLEEQRSDADGNAEFGIDLQQFRQGTYQLRLSAEGFDQAGGRSVSATSSALISPLETIIGYKADGDLSYINADGKRSVEFIAIDKQLQQQVAGNLTMKLVEIQKLSTLVRQQNNTYAYQTVDKEVEVSSTPLKIEEGGYQFQIDSANAGDFVLEIYDAAQLRLARVNYSVVGFANLTGRIDKNAELQLRLNKKDFLPGEMIEMSIKAPYAGAGLITIETDKLHHFKWFKTDQQSTLQQIRVPYQLEGSAYVSVAFVRDPSSPEIFTSPLSYAVQPFSIDKSKRRVDIKLDTEAIVRPGKPMKIAYSASKPSKILVFAVDEGILQVAKYQTPNPLGHFLKKRALDVQTMQILDLILPDFNLVKQLSASGGGASSRRAALAANLNPFSRKTDKAAVFWSGIYDADEITRDITFDVPNSFAGELRVMAVAVGEDSVGAKSRSAIVRGPFVISPNVLTQASPGDEFEVTVGVANIIEGSGKQVPINLSVSASRHLEILGPGETVLNIDEGGEGKFSFRVKANAVLGAAELSFHVKHGNEDSTRTASLSVRPASRYITSLVGGYDQDGQLELPNQRKLFDDLHQQSVAASASPLVIVDGLTAYLEHYPHGCTEQVVSKVFPLVGLMSHPAYAAELGSVNRQFSVLINKLRERQLGDGGFAFWPQGNQSADYPSIYVMHFLLEASEQGHPVPADMMQRGKSFLQSFLTRSQNGRITINEARDRAIAMYLLTRMGQVTTNALVDLEESLKKHHAKSWQKDILASYVAATYQLLQKSDEANRLIDGYQMGQDVLEHNDFRSVLALDAQHIYLLARHFEPLARDLDGQTILALTEKIYRGEYNTISSAYSILALGAYSKLALSNEFNENIEFTSIDANKQSRILTAALQPFLKASYPLNNHSLQIKGEQALYYLDRQSGFDIDPPQQALAQGIEIFREFVDDEGNPVTSYEQGKELTVRLRVRALGDRLLSNVALVDLLPGGFEVKRSSVARSAHGWRADYVDIREDRVVYYGSFDQKVRELSYRVKLTTAGDFIIPAAYANSMYDRSVRANTAASRFSVIASK